MIVGIDQSLTATGVACLSRGVPIKLHTVTSKPGPIEPRLLGIMREVDAKMCSGGKPALVVMEGLSAGSFGATSSILELAGLHFLIRLQLHSRGIPFHVVSPLALKKFVCGSGAAKKEHMLKAVLQRWSIDTDDNNQADAAGLAYIGAAMSGWWPADNQAQRDVLAKLLAGPEKKTRKRKW